MILQKIGGSKIGGGAITGGVGGAELSFQLLFSPFVENSATLILVILIWRLITYYFGIFAGIIAYIIPARKNVR